MRIRYLKLKSWLLAALAGLLGISFSSCEKYGCPEADYHVKGTVTNEQGQPIAGVGVCQNNWYDDRSYSDTTDADGHYSVDCKYAMPGEPLSLGFYDIDGVENGSYNDTIVTINTENVPLHGGHGEWYEGEATITKNVTLTEKANK